MLDELLLGGEIQETSKKNVLKAIAAQDLLQEVRARFRLKFRTLGSRLRCPDQPRSISGATRAGAAIIKSFGSVIKGPVKRKFTTYFSLTVFP